MRKTTKKVISVLLSFILAVCSMPFVALADDATAGIEAAIAGYETAMDGTIKTNMAAAYDAYVAANKALDAYKYGGADINLGDYASALNTAVSNMSAWSYNGIETAEPSFENDSEANGLQVYKDHGVANILYWGSNAEADGAKYTSGVIANVEIELWYPANTVLLLDGKKVPAMPILGMARKNTGNNRYVYQIYPCVSGSDSSASQYFKMGTSDDTAVWYGSNGNSNRNHNWTWTVLRKSGTDTGRIKGDAGSNTTSTALNMSRNFFGTNYWASFANVMRFYGEQTDYVKSYTVDWYAVSGDQPNDYRYMNPTQQVHVLNYKALLDEMNKQSHLNFLDVDPAEYTQGGLRNYLVAYDAATSFNVGNYNYSDISNGLGAAATAIETATNGLKNASATADVDNYDTLRKAMDDVKATYDDEEGPTSYTEETWNSFTQAYDAAKAFFASVPTDGYTKAAEATELADDLDTAYKALETKVVKVDTTELEIAINEADSAIANNDIFTADSYAASNIASVVNTAKTSVWGGASHYPIPAYRLDLSDDNTALVESLTDSLGDAIFALRIDKNAPVILAGNKSMNEALADAAEINADDYGNYADLANAVAAANSFSAAVNTISKNCVADKIADYKAKVRAITNAIARLRPAFDKITNATWGSFSEDTTNVSSSGSPGNRWQINFKRNNNVVVFRTEYDPFTVDLGGATLEWYSGDGEFDAHLDSINVFDESTENTVGEIVTSGAAFFFVNPNATSLPDPENYPGMLSAGTEQNSTYTLRNLTVSSSPATKLGTDLEGDAITDNDFIFDEFLSSTQGSNTDLITGTVTTNNGTAYIHGDYTISIPRETKRKLTAETLPKLTTHTLASNFGMVYYWKYTNTGIRWLGYSHNRSEYNQTTYVINIAPLMELINECKAIQADQNQYKTASWNAFAEALSEARADMDYGNMSAAAIESATQTRYTNLWNAYKALEKSATNTAIRAVVEDENVGDTYRAKNNDGRWSAARWATFKDAYEAAASAIANGGTYSDANVRDYGTEEQPAIDAIAAALTTAYNELTTYGPRADFTALFNAAGRVGYDALENNKYTATSLKAVADALKDATEYPYLNMTETERNAVYSETAETAAIRAEVEKINNLYATTPVEAVVDGDALAAAKVNAKAAITNPDAFGNIDEIKALIDAADYSEDVAIYGGYSVTGVKYDTQDELNSAVAQLLNGLTAKQYEVKVVDAGGNAVDAVIKDENGNVIEAVDGKIMLDYGTKVVVYAPENEEVDWFYSYSSNTVEQTSSKYYTTDKWIHITVRGNTTLTVKSTAQATETVKVTYVNAQTGKTFAVDYTEKDAEYTLQAAPALAYYTFAGYTLDEDSEDYVDSITPSEDTVVFANYELDEEAVLFTVTVQHLSGGSSKFNIEDLEYNDLIEFTLGDGTNDEETGGIYNSGSKGFGQYTYNGEVTKFTGNKQKGLRYAEDEIYAWTAVKADDFDAWDELRDDESGAAELAGIEKVVMYGDTFSFRVCEDVYVIPYTEEEFEEAVEGGYIEGVSATEKAAVYANQKVLNETGGQKISMIGNFTLPTGNFELVEAGMLFKATTDGTIPSADLILGNAGTNGIARMKSTSHTAGNQFVISVNTKKFIGTNTTIGVIYKAYMIYTDGTNQFVVYSNAVTDSAVIE